MLRLCRVSGPDEWRETPAQAVNNLLGMEAWCSNGWRALAKGPSTLAGIRLRLLLSSQRNPPSEASPLRGAEGAATSSRSAILF
jgi:hypothetical protein